MWDDRYILITAPLCGECKVAKRALDKANIQYKEYNATLPEVLKKISKIQKEHEIVFTKLPVLISPDYIKFYIGFNAIKTLEELNESK